MGLFRLTRQTWTLCKKDLLIVVWRSWLSTFLRAVALPVAYMFFIAYVRNFFLPPSEYGIGQTPHRIRDLTTEVFNSSTDLNGRNRVVFVNNGFVGGQIDELIDRLATPLTEAGADVQLASSDTDLFDLCPSTLTGLSSCYGALEFSGSPTEGFAGIWSYTARMDFGLGLSPYVNADDNDAQVYTIPFVHYIDAGIAEMEGVEFPRDQLEYPFTYETRQERADEIQRFFMRALGDYLAVTMFIGICGITYHLPGHLATEREIGMSSLIDSMLYTSHQSISMLARLVSTYQSFFLVYLPGWLAMGAIVTTLMFEQTSASIIIPFHLLTGMSLTGYSIFMASFFRKAQLSGTTTLILALVLAIIAQFLPRTQIVIGVLSCLFPPIAYTFFQIEISQYEVRLLPYTLNQQTFGWSLPGYLYFVFLVVQIIVYPLLAAFVQWALYGTPNRCRRGLAGNDESSLRIVNFTKVFKRGFWQHIFRRGSDFTAVNDLSLALSPGHVVALLGANGSGKSTTLAAIAGTQSTTSGHIERSPHVALGFCPQRNTLWDQLTVTEHVKIFNALKAKDKPQPKGEVKDLIVACDLEKKIKKKSKTLSGGQKRKLQLAMAFIGRSEVCCVDEVSSGLDPLSRRKIWNILLAERHRRTLLLTTHALDEADALADDIVIMSKGQLVVQGSAPELKHLHGGGYQVVTRDAAATSVPTVPHTVGLNGDYNFTADTSAEARDISRTLRQHGVRDLQIHGPTIQDVFLGLSREYADELSQMPTSASPGASQDDTSSSKGGERGVVTTVKPSTGMLSIESGRGTSFIGQTWILYRKRLLIFTRNWLPYLCSLTIAIAAAGLTTRFLAGFDRLMCSRGELASTPQTLSLGALERFWGVLVPVGPTEQFTIQQLPAQYLPFSDRIRPMANYAEFQQYHVDNFRDVAPGGFYLGQDLPVDPAPLMTYRINGNLGYSALAKNILDSYLTGLTINAEFTTFSLPFAVSTGDSLQLVLYITFAMCCYSAFFALYPTFERISNVRALHYSNGVRPAPLWLAYWLFDGFFAIVVAIVSIVILATISDVWFAPSYLCIVILLFGLSSILLAYMVSLFATSQLAAFAFVAGGQAVFGLVYFLIYMVLLTFGSAESLQTNLNILQYTLGLITPSGNLLRALLLSLNQAQILCRTQEFVDYPGAIDVYGSPILYLVLQILAFYAFLVWYDSGWRPSLFKRSRALGGDAEKDAVAIPDDVRAETARTENSLDKLRILHLHKRFGKDHVVNDVTLGVDGSEIMALLGPNGAGKTTTLSMIRGNLKPSSRESDILISGASMRRNQGEGNRQLGVTPQFDTTDYMTVTEHLSFYARVRGVSDIESNVTQVIHAVGLSPYSKRKSAKLSGGNQRKLSLATSIIGNPSVLLLDEPSTGMDAVAMRIMWRAISSIKQGRAIVLTTHSMEEASALSDKVSILDRRLLAVSGTSDLIKLHGQGRYHVHVTLTSGVNASAEEMERVRAWFASVFPGSSAHDASGAARRGQLRLAIPIQSLAGKEGVETQADVEETPQVNESDPLERLFDLLEDNKRELGISYYSISQPALEDVFLDVLSRNRDLEDE